MIRIAINGFGRIGRLVFRRLHAHPDLAIVAINDLTDAPTLAHLLRYDSAHGPWPVPVVAHPDRLEAGDRSVAVFSEKDPGQLPWQELQIDVVLECTGVFTTREGLALHRQAGARKVILSAPPKGEGVPSLVLGVNDHTLTPDMDILSNASCTTNCLAPVARLLHEALGISSGFVTTTHAYTMDQRLHDAPHRDLRRARAAAVNIVPTSTGAAKALGMVYPPLAGKLEAMALRVPVITGSLIDVHLQLDQETDRDTVNRLVREAAEGPLQGIIAYTEDPLVSSDIIGHPASAIFDGQLTRVRGNLLKIIAWYDNEAGYAARLADLALRVGHADMAG